MADEFVIGKKPHEDRPYDDGARQVGFNEIIFELNTRGIKGPFVIIPMGKLGSPGRSISAYGTVLEKQDLLNARKTSGSYGKKWQKMMGANMPFHHISAVVIRPLPPGR